MSSYKCKQLTADYGETCRDRYGEPKNQHSTLKGLVYDHEHVGRVQTEIHVFCLCSPIISQSVPLVCHTSFQVSVLSGQSSMLDVLTWLVHSGAVSPHACTPKGKLQLGVSRRGKCASRCHDLFVRMYAVLKLIAHLIFSQHVSIS